MKELFHYLYDNKNNSKVISINNADAEVAVPLISDENAINNVNLDRKDDKQINPTTTWKDKIQFFYNNYDCKKQISPFKCLRICKRPLS